MHRFTSCAFRLIEDETTRLNTELNVKEQVS
jgi:hypothetical protein